MKSLYDEVRTEQNVFSAWRHVKRSALSSGDSEIRGNASKFEHEHQKHLRRIIDQLRKGRFKFEPVKGVLKDKKKRQAQGKAPRPIAIATLESRVVQRAILQILQPREIRDPKDLNSREATKQDNRLGLINNVNHSRFGVGGLIHPYGGVRPAIEAICAAIDGGAKYFYQSDIKSFFTDIRTSLVIDFIRKETKDEALTELFTQALSIELANPDELKEHVSLFPHDGIGVAQGSSLSAFAGNVLLFDMDHSLNRMGVTSIRYIDDILMVSDSYNSLEDAIEFAKATLTSFGFGLYSPGDGSDKAKRGECVNAIDFLGCTIQPRRCVPSAQSMKKIKASVNDAISTSKAAIIEAVRRGRPVDSKASQSATLKLIGERLYGWQKAFGFCNDPQPFAILDEYVAKQVIDYQRIVGRTIDRADASTHMSILGIPSMRDMFDREGRKHITRT
jgi:retron-type reverse transcriptase